ncbi:dephospho-CoA kinase [Helcobacillus massiliensis]|uniref:dephospho-CoA kinase n=1 Tax=Helcobacillus massiliensis TaxID=521392 RepID=UPI0021A828C5|nr:dephospho-CoA kinase [Helcobacillus massiliensis]MCT1556992.1 dephospho-CoA kinase [Helcobacillus massiliensis]MCT2035381.1 dephospho-CoA kinase [Helcobacillus massiliensis]MCT2331404.1 dephospho-CoA kinase [Helcobacillus massiliensis]MDK7741062.1 dephospho-CoA kinase [Helcobacillus massiliensis]WOO93874.1 dephospho-CoA kinase [Helcobacillus massiliensis]
MRHHLQRVGLTGGIGSGKTTVADRFRETGITVIDLDELSRAVLDQPGEGVDDMVARFGAEYLNRAGTADRAKLGDLVFSEAAARADLERIVLTRVAEQVSALDEAAAAAGEEFIVHDSPLLLEKGHDADFAVIIGVLAPVEERIRRVMQRSNKTREWVERVIAAQTTDDQRRRRCHILIDNTGTREDLAAAADAAVGEVRRMLAPSDPH